MISTYDNLTVDGIAAIAFDEPTNALRLLRDLGGHGVADAAFERLLVPLTAILAISPDPDRALVNFCTWIDRVGSRTMYYDLLADHPAALEALLKVFATSQYLSGILFQHPEYLEILANPTIRDRERSMADFLSETQRRLRLAKTVGKKRDALRRFKLPEFLRIGARDILGYADFLQTVAEISDFAEACVRAALAICEAPAGFAVIGMGKLGGRELNYASDIDLIFMHDDHVDQSIANKVGEAVRDTLAEATPAGFVFRVDLRLRPEGRFGPISRSVGSCAAYFESWAEPWERQALVKARVVAGDEELGAEFLRLAEAFVYRKATDDAFVRAIQENKRLLERQTARHGEARDNVKQGIGGIRDVEFAVQQLQLIAGGRMPEVRTGNTLEALERLANSGLLDSSEKAVFAEGYVFLRDVEHRLQIMDERPVRVIPAGNAKELDKFGKRLGYANGAAFLVEYRRQTAAVNALFKRVFYGDEALELVRADAEEVTDWLRTINDPSSESALRNRLANLGFLDTEAAFMTVKRAELGTSYGEFTPAARDGFTAVASAMLSASAASGAPDEALAGLDRLAEAVPSRAALYGALGDEPQFLARLALLAGRAPYLWQQLLAHQEYVDLIGDETQLDQMSPPPVNADTSSLAAFIRRERMRIGARDVWGLLDTKRVMEEITAVADAVLETALAIPGFEDAAYSLAIVGLGKLGGAELGYGSDLDVLWVHDGKDAERATALAMAVTRLVGTDLKAHGADWEIDARLRPDGRVGTLVRTVGEYEAYYKGGAAQTWEHQALIKARFAAGNAPVGGEFVAMARRVVYSAPITTAQVDEIRAMKMRIERERCKDKAEVKFGLGGLSDIEWTTQLLQWTHGVRWPKAHAPGTLAALRALRDAGAITQNDWELLSGVYTELTAQRNHIWLRNGHVRGVPVAPNPALDTRRCQVHTVYERLFLGE